MVTPKIRRWIRKQLDQGESPKELKQALREKGYDPDIVDQIQKESEVSKEAESGEMKDLVEKTEHITGKLEEQVKKGWKLELYTVFMISIAAAVVFMAGPLTQQIIEPDQSMQNNLSESQDEPSLVGNNVAVNFSEGVAKPSRPSIASNETILFRNEAGYDIQLVFESDKNSVRINAGSTKEVSFNSLTYYTAQPVKDEGEEISGSVVVR